MDVSIIIVNYNTKDLVAQCVDSIFEQTVDIEFEVIVVDNNSDDGSKDVLSKDTRIKFVEACVNLGFGRANNLGVTKSQGKYVFFLNSDTLLVNNAIKLLFDYCESSIDKKIGSVGGLLEDLNGKHVHSYGYFPSIWTIPKGLCESGIQLLLRKDKKVIGCEILGNEQFVDYVTGADVFVRRDVIEKFGAFDPDFFMYFEDTEMQKRWHTNGFQSIIIRSPRIIHLEGCSTKIINNKLNERKLYMGLRSQIMYFKKTETRLFYYLYRMTAFLYLLPVFRGKYNLRQVKNILLILFSSSKYDYDYKRIKRN